VIEAVSEEGEQSPSDNEIIDDSDDFEEE